MRGREHKEEVQSIQRVNFAAFMTLVKDWARKRNQILETGFEDYGWQPASQSVSRHLALNRVNQTETSRKRPNGYLKAKQKDLYSILNAEHLCIKGKGRAAFLC